MQSFCCRVDGVERVLCEMFLQMCDCLCATKRASIWMLLSIGVDLISRVVCCSVLQCYSVLWCVAVCQYRDWFVWSGVAGYFELCGGIYCSACVLHARMRAEKKKERVCVTCRPHACIMTHT